MDYISSFDIRLNKVSSRREELRQQMTLVFVVFLTRKQQQKQEKTTISQDVYYAGETISGSVLLENTENIKIRGIRVLLRGKVHATLKVVKSGERRTLKDDQYVLDEKQLLWGKGEHSNFRIHFSIRGSELGKFVFCPNGFLKRCLKSGVIAVKQYLQFGICTSNPIKARQISSFRSLTLSLIPEEL